MSEGRGILQILEDLVKVNREVVKELSKTRQEVCAELSSLKEELERQFEIKLPPGLRKAVEED